MSSTAISPASRWPYRPSWELDGFDFRDIKAACCRRAGSYNNLSTQHFTTGLPDRTRLSEADRSRVVANNVARKRGLSESTQALGHDFDTPQRPSKKFPEADGKFQTEVQLPDPFPEPEERESLRTPWTNKSGSRSIIASVVNNGEALPQQLNLTHSHGAELTVQEDDMALHSARIEDLEWRVGSIESKPPVSKELRDSIAELKEKMNNSNLYINSEVKKLWTDVRSTLEQEQGRLRALFDSFSADYSIDKVRTEYYQKSIEKQTRLMKKRRRAEKLHRDQLDELSSRVAELEENAKGDKESSDSEEDEYPAHVDARFAALSRRVTELENHRELNAQRTKQSIIDKLTQHILSLETQVCHLQKRSSN
ncbi:hypothetical protein C7999DRAFT_31998 [Corynascus novoguineensis]|uniref:Uncharacterized protein n=1 Tax=Corynascus novoguineensis TaxID=1126955 RepID=A0AAN7HNR1_9PEZI|nr:hypothetical protein C7999DRAFT_31998 [Corynascus novoguineensis]